MRWILWLLVVIILLVHFYRHREEEEEYLVWKLLGYYLLGGFRFTINTVALPLGFVIYLAVFKPQKNRQIKSWAAYLGLAAFIIGIVGAAV